jgi:hypothetical protein
MGKLLVEQFIRKMKSFIICVRSTEESQNPAEPAPNVNFWRWTGSTLDLPLLDIVVWNMILVGRWVDASVDQTVFGLTLLDGVTWWVSASVHWWVGAPMRLAVKSNRSQEHQCMEVEIPWDCGSMAMSEVTSSSTSNTRGRIHVDATSSVLS